MYTTHPITTTPVLLTRDDIARHDTIGVHFTATGGESHYFVATVVAVDRDGLVIIRSLDGNLDSLDPDADEMYAVDASGALVKQPAVRKADALREARTLIGDAMILLANAGGYPRLANVLATVISNINTDLRNLKTR